MADTDAIGVLDVAKKKGAKAANSGPEGWQRKPLIANFRGSREFQEWLHKLAKADRETVAGVIERALVHYARAIGFTEEAPDR